ncbi:MAG: succinate dehydrogenase, cytochrome b556 subunit [Pseudomonadota bacterium]
MANARTSADATPSRPLSPHLQVYSPLINMVMSIFHRITGSALYFGTILLAAWLVAAAIGPTEFNYVAALFDSWIGRLVLLGYTWALMHHMLGGIRHFIWDTGAGFDLAMVDMLSWGTLVGSALLTAAIWAAVLLM